MTDKHGAFSHLWPGVALALGSALLFGASTPFAKLLVTRIDPVLLAGLLYLGAGVGLALASGIQRIARRHSRVSTLRLEDWPWLLGMIVCGGVAGPVLLMFGLAHSDAATASLLLNVEGLATMAIAWVVFRENVDRRLMIGAGCILLGAVLLSWSGEGFALSAGAGLMIAACLAWGLDNNITRQLSGADPVQLVTLKGLAAGFVTLSLGVAQGAALPSAMELVAALLLGFVSYGLSIVMFVLALRHLGTARTGAYFSTAPFVGALIAIAAFDAPLTLILVAAGLLMSIGVWLHATERHVHEHVHEPMEHTHSHVHDAHHQHEHGPLDPPGEPHTHAHAHALLVHSHPHYPDLHHRHDHLKNR
jgi:drug/metabolite transporter (DMT)-like permease